MSLSTKKFRLSPAGKVESCKETDKFRLIR